MSLLLCLHWANVTYWYGSVQFGTVINYSVNCCTTVPYRTKSYPVGSLASVGLVRCGTVPYSTLGNGGVNSFLLVLIQISPCLHQQGPYSWARYIANRRVIAVVIRNIVFDLRLQYIANHRLRISQSSRCMCNIIDE